MSEQKARELRRQVLSACYDDWEKAADLFAAGVVDHEIVRVKEFLLEQARLILRGGFEPPDIAAGE